MNDIQICEKSTAYLNDVFSQYKLKELPEWNPRFTGTVIFHLYPIADTMNDENENLEGFIDAVMFDVHIYSPDKKEKYIIHNRDQVEINLPKNRSKIRIFKDLSTMIIVHGGCSLAIFQSMEINE